jgi:phosphoglycolate phosphatase
MLLEILDELGVDAGEALMVGDTEHDLRMANNAEVDAVAVTSGAQGREILEALGPVAILDDVRALPAWLDGL